MLLPSDNGIIEMSYMNISNMPKEAALLNKLFKNILHQNKDGIYKIFRRKTLELSEKKSKTAVLTSEKATGTIKTMKADS